MFRLCWYFYCFSDDQSKEKNYNGTYSKCYFSRSEYTSLACLSNIDSGGVAMGTASDMAVQPFGALLIGLLAGVLSTFGYSYIKVS